MKYRLTESRLRNIINEAVNSVLENIDPRTWAEIARRYEQTDPEKSQKAQERAIAAWNRRFGFSYQNGPKDWGETIMGGNNQFTNNGSSRYGISHRSERTNPDGKGWTHSNLAYNPKDNRVWTGDGMGNSTEYQPSREMEYGDNGAWQVAREMENGTGVYIKGKGWQPQ